jgi:uncharacterized protein (DUF427 family)
MALDPAQHMFAALPELRSHATAKRIRALLDGAVVVDSTRALIVWEPRRVVPSYAVPIADIDGSLVESAATRAAETVVQLGDGPPVLDPRTGFSFHTAPGQAFDLQVGSSTLTAAAFVPEDADLAGHAVLDFDAFEEWREEDELLVGHARDPFKTVDVRQSSRSVVVEIDGTVVAESAHPTMLFETYLPTRYYLAPADVRMDLLHRSSTESLCAYKGRATYWSADVNGIVADDVAWSYEAPHNYATAVRGMVAFFNERVDITLDGQPLDRPRTPWS